MYLWLWRSLPGGTATRTVLCLLLFAVAVVVLFTLVFPHTESLLPFGDVTVNGRTGRTSG